MLVSPQNLRILQIKTYNMTMNKRAYQCLAAQRMHENTVETRLEKSTITRKIPAALANKSAYSRSSHNLYK